MVYVRAACTYMFLCIKKMMSLGFDPKAIRLEFMVDKVATGAGVFPRTWVHYRQRHSFSVS